MSLQPAVVSFYSGYPIDKIVQQDTVMFTLPAGTPAPAGPYPNVLQTVPNKYGQKALVRASYAIDGVNFNSSVAQLYYFSSFFAEPVLQASLNIGCDASLVYFWLNNNFTSDLAFTINYALYTIS